MKYRAVGQFFRKTVADKQLMHTSPDLPSCFCLFLLVDNVKSHMEIRKGIKKNLAARFCQAAPSIHRLPSLTFLCIWKTAAIIGYLKTVVFQSASCQSETFSSFLSRLEQNLTMLQILSFPVLHFTAWHISTTHTNSRVPLTNKNARLLGTTLPSVTEYTVW